jgi:hypothetical protein
MDDFAYALARLRRMTLLEWTHGILIMAFIVSATISVYGIGETL